MAKGSQSKIKKSVGEGGANQPEDVATVQYLLNLSSERLKVPAKTVAVDGKVGKHTDAAIREYQKKYCKEVDGLLDPGGETMTSLNKTTPVFAANDGRHYLAQDEHGKPFA